MLSISTKARNLWMGVRRRMNERDARLAAEAAGAKPQASRPAHRGVNDSIARDAAPEDPVVEADAGAAGDQAAAPVPSETPGSEVVGQEAEAVAASD